MKIAGFSRLRSAREFRRRNFFMAGLRLDISSKRLEKNYLVFNAEDSFAKSLPSGKTNADGDKTDYIEGYCFI